jgi:hypothetical protein
MNSIIWLISLIFKVLFYIIIPAIPGAVLWWFLKPVLFWEKFAWFLTSVVFYIIIFLFIIFFIAHIIYNEEGEEETMDQKEK